MVCLTADANCSSVMSSTKTVLAEGSSGRASADPIISKVIPCFKKNSFHENAEKLITFMCNERSQTQKNTCCMLLFARKGKSRETQSRLVVAKNEGENRECL